ncbi:MAG: translation elongation factor Ts [Parachlamydiaceae bacterium]
MGQPITATLIKELRDLTGIGMGKCKEALEESGGDIELAVSNLRKKGLASAAKKEDRAANEGIVVFAENGNAIAIVEVNAETDFVVRNERFLKFAQEVAEEAAATAPADLAKFMAQKFSKDPSLTLDEYRATVVQAIGENIQVRRVTILKKDAGKSVGMYSHLGGKMVTAVEITGNSGEESLAKDIAMHVAASNPEYLAPESVPASIIENEKEIAKGQLQGKPANMLDKIVEGKLNAYYDSACLVRQKFIRDDSLSIQSLVDKRSKESGKPLKLVSFLRWSVGGN